MTISELKPVDIVSILIIIGGFILVGLGKDKTVSLMLVAVSSYYLGHGRNE